MMSFNFRGKNKEIDNYADLIILGESKKQIEIPHKIWLFWDGPMPLIVKDCLNKVQLLHPDYKVYILNNQNIKDYCDIDFEAFTSITFQQKADLIRLYLLYHYGGYWLDASILLYEKVDWIAELMQKNGSEAFAYYREKNTTMKNLPVLENWLLVSVKGNQFFEAWLKELIYAISISPKQYITELRKDIPNYHEYFQKIGNLEYLVAYVACQKVMRITPVNFTLINCDENAFYYQVKAKWMKQKILVCMATNLRPNVNPKLIKLAGKERFYLNKYYEKDRYIPGSLLDFKNLDNFEKQIL